MISVLGSGFKKTGFGSDFKRTVIFLTCHNFFKTLACEENNSLICFHSSHEEGQDMGVKGMGEGKEGMSKERESGREG